MQALREYVLARCMPVPHAGCWLWLASAGSHGYGQAWDGETVRVAHRLSYRAFKGPIPPGRLVQHSCDTRICVNPDHLSLGTDRTNAHDKQRKGRAAKKLTAADVREIRALVARRVPHADIARRFGISLSMIWGIHSRRHWRHVI